MKLDITKAMRLIKQNNGSLDLRGTQITALPDNLTVGGSLYLSGTQITNKDKARKKVKKLTDGAYVQNRYVYADGILTHVVKKKTVGAYVLFVGKIKGKNVVFDGKNYAHCDSMRDGIADLLFKSAADRGANQYADLTLESEIKTEDAITMYRVITGACRQGTQAFVDQLGDLKESYKVSEIIKLTAGKFGAERFAEFFNR